MTLDKRLGSWYNERIGTLASPFPLRGKAGKVMEMEMQTEMEHPERDSELWRQAWSVLRATGRDPADGWMLMHVDRVSVPGGCRFAFKNHSLCERSMADDPAYDGKTKYVYLPA